MTVLEGQVAIVTGASGGIGSAVSQRLLREGAVVATVDIVDADFMSELAPDVRHRASHWQCDVTSSADVSELCRRIERALGPASILVNVAGGSGAHVAHMPEDITDALWNEVMSLNVTSVLRFARALVPAMKAAGFGRIVNMSSTLRNGVFGPVGTLGARLPYVTSKAALVGMTRQLAKDLGPFGITVNAVAPGLTLPGENSRIARRFHALSSEARAKLVDHIPTGGPSNADDICHLVMAMVSPAAKQLNGQVIDVDGGA